MLSVICQTPITHTASLCGAVKGSDINKHHTHETLHALQLGQSNTSTMQGLPGKPSPRVWAPSSTVWLVREAAWRRLPKPQTSHSMPMERCASETKFPDCISPHSYFLHFPEVEGKQPPSTSPVGNKLRHRLPPTTAQTQKKLLMTSSSEEIHLSWMLFLPVLSQWCGGQSKTPATLLWCFSKITYETLETLNLLIYKIPIFVAGPTKFKESTSL